MREMMDTERWDTSGFPGLTLTELEGRINWSGNNSGRVEEGDIFMILGFSREEGRVIIYNLTRDCIGKVYNYDTLKPNSREIFND